ncbi:MAG: hypothetical protein IKP47_02965 [Ruminococcus sp.]|nr:hypothetical protein [Ruminococcus sp.]
MTTEIIVALLSLIGTFLGTFSGIRLVTYRIEQLERKVEKHNSVIERMALAEKDIRVASHRIEDLEKWRDKL